MKRFLLIATVVKKHIMVFHLPILKLFKEMGWKTVVVAHNDYDDPYDCVIPYCDHFINIPFERSPIKLTNLKAYKELKKVIDSDNYDIIHCHTPVGAMLTRLAARRARKQGTKVIYTAHGFHFYKGAPLMNWLLYYPVEKLCSRWTDILITINNEDYERAKKKMHAKEVVYVPGVGIDLTKFVGGVANRNEKRRELGIPVDATLLISVGELNDNKNHATVIKAINGMNVYYIIAGVGNKEKYLQELIDEQGMTNRIKLLGFRSDVSELYAISDIFVFPSFREGLSVSLMEAMASGLPCAVSKIRGNVDLIDENGGVYFDPYDLKDVRHALERLVCEHKNYGAYNTEKIKSFSNEVVLLQIKDIYDSHVKSNEEVLQDR